MRDLNDLTRPTIPSRAIQERMAAETEERRTSAGPAEALADDAGAPADLRAALGKVVDELAPQIIDLSHDIHDHLRDQAAISARHVPLHLTSRQVLQHSTVEIVAPVAMRMGITPIIHSRWGDGALTP